MYTEFLSWDDKVVVVENPVVNQGLSTKNAIEALREPILNLWSPVSQWSHQIDVSLFGMNPDAHHLMGIFYHLLAGIALWWAISALPRFNDNLISKLFIVGAFLLHPAQVESWAWISERKDLLAALFSFLTVGAWIRWIRTGNGKQLILVIAACMLGLMAKPIVVMLPVILIAIWWIAKDEIEMKSYSKKITWGVLGVISLASLVVIVITLNINWGRDEMITISQFTPIQRAQIGFSNYPRYLIKIFYPAELSYFYPIPRVAPNLFAVLGLCFVLSSAWLCVRGLKKKSIWSICPLVFICFLAPTVGFIISGESYGPDRYGYIANVGIFLFIALIFERYKINMGWQITGLSVLLFILAYMSLQQAKSWQNMYALTNHALKQDDENYKALFDQALWHKDRSNNERFIELITKVYKIRPDHQEAACILGALAMQNNAFLEAEQYFMTHQSYWEKHQVSLEGLAAVRAKQGKLKQAIAHYYELEKSYPGVKRYQQNIEVLSSAIDTRRKE